MARTNYSMKISLTDEQAKALASGSANEVDAIQSIAQTAVSLMASGAFLIPQAQRARIEKIIGRIEKPEDLVQHVESNAGREGDNYVLSVTIDPVFVGELEEKAEISGLSIDCMLTDLFTQALHMGMFYDMNTERTPLLFTQSQILAIRERLHLMENTPLTGDRIARHLGWKDETEEFDMFAQPALAER